MIRFFFFLKSTELRLVDLLLRVAEAPRASKEISFNLTYVGVPAHINRQVEKPANKESSH